MAIKNNSKNNKHPLCREVTHTQYTGIKKIGDKGPQSWLQKVIVPLDEYFYKSKMGHPYVSDEFIKMKSNSHITPFAWGGQFYLLLFL